MRFRAAVVLLFALPAAGCMLHHSSAPSPVKCPQAPAPDLADAPVVGHVSLSGQPRPLVQGPYTVVLDDNVVVVARNGDAHAAAKILRDIDPATIESIEMVRSADRTDRYPGATGDILRIRRCYATAH